jgi:cyanophycinase
MPKGKLLVIGGAEDKGPIRNPPIIKLKNRNYVDYDILGRLIHNDDPFHNTIEIITTASQQPLKTGNMYIRSFKKMGFSKVGHISIQNKEESKNAEFVERVRTARVVFFSGGDQSRLTGILTGSELLRVIFDRYEHDETFLLAGTSAGAMAMSDHMIYHAENNEAMLKGHVKITHGFGLLKNCVVDTHFVKRGRFGRLFQATLMNADSIGIGLGEDTGMLFERGIGTCIGSGMVVIVDPSQVQHTNKQDAADNEPISADNFVLHVLTRDDQFDLQRFRMIPKRSNTLAGQDQVSDSSL